MSIQLKLDSAALEALFPPGSPARIELQSAVIAEFTRKHIKDALVGEPMRSEVKRVRDELASKMLHDSGIQLGTWGGYKLNTEATKELRHQVGVEVTAVIRSATHDAVENLRGTIERDVQAAVNRMTDAEVRRAVKERVRAVIDNLGAGA